MSGWVSPGFIRSRSLLDARARSLSSKFRERSSACCLLFRLGAFGLGSARESVVSSCSGAPIRSPTECYASLLRDSRSPNVLCCRQRGRWHPHQAFVVRSGRVLFSLAPLLPRLLSPPPLPATSKAFALDLDSSYSRSIVWAMTFLLFARVESPFSPSSIRGLIAWSSLLSSSVARLLVDLSTAYPFPDASMRKTRSLCIRNGPAEVQAVE